MDVVMICDELLTAPQHITEPDWVRAREKVPPPLTAVMPLSASAGTKSKPFALFPHVTTFPALCTPAGA
jgi:hypothetical protein